MRWQFFAVHIFLTLFYLVPLHGYHNIMISHFFCWTQLCVVQVIQLWTLSAFGHCIWDQPGLWSRKSWKLQRKSVWTARAQIWSWLSAGMAKQTHWSENFILENIGYGSCTVTQPQLHWIICVVVVQLFSSSQVTQSQRRKVSTFQWSGHCTVVQHFHFHGLLANSMPKLTLCNVWYLPPMYLEICPSILCRFLLCSFPPV